jgi:hypothetical protein
MKKKKKKKAFFFLFPHLMYKVTNIETWILLDYFRSPEKVWFQSQLTVLQRVRSSS